MNLPTIIVLLLVASALGLALWLNRRNGRRLTDCGCGSSGSSCGRGGDACRGCHGCDYLKENLRPNCRSNESGCSR